MGQISKETKDIYRKHSKKKQRKDSLVRFLLHFLLIPRAIKERKKTKRPRGFVLCQMRINLNRASRMSLHLMQPLNSKKETSLYNEIREVHLVPKSWTKWKKINEFLKDLLKEKSKNNSLAIDEVLGKIQIGPFLSWFLYPGVAKVEETLLLNLWTKF